MFNLTDKKCRLKRSMARLHLLYDPSAISINGNKSFMFSKIHKNQHMATPWVKIGLSYALKGAVLWHHTILKEIA